MNNLFGDKQVKVLKFTGDRKKASLDDGTVLNRKDKIKIPGDDEYRCMPYDNHFIFRHVFGDRGWTLWCTCGSPAVILNYNQYKQYLSRDEKGAMLACKHYTDYGRHMDGST